MASMSSVFPMFFVFLFIVAFVPLGLTLLGLLFKQVGEVSDPEWELYQHRYD